MNEYVASIWVACMRLVMSLLGALAIQKLNRTTLACMSGVGMFLAMLAAGFYEHLFSALPPSSRPLPWVPLACFLVHVCVSMLGYLQLPWIMTGELFPLRARGAMGGIVSSLAHLLIFTSVKTYPDLRNAIGKTLAGHSNFMFTCRAALVLFGATAPKKRPGGRVPSTMSCLPDGS